MDLMADDVHVSDGETGAVIATSKAELRPRYGACQQMCGESQCVGAVIATSKAELWPRKRDEPRCGADQGVQLLLQAAECVRSQGWGGVACG